MATLTETARTTKIAVKIGGVVLIALIVGRVTLAWSVAIYRRLNPPPPPAATVGFGRLPEITFEEKQVPQLSYRLETVNGSVPTFGPSASVFFISKQQTTILGLDRGKQKASALGFLFEPEQVSGTLYRWTKSTPLPASLELDYTSGVFELGVLWETDPAFLNSRLIPSELQAISEAKSFLKKAGALPQDLDSGVAKAIFLKQTGRDSAQALSISEADFVRVDLFRAPIDGSEVLPSDPNKGVARVLISGNRDQGKRIISAEFRHTQVEYQVFETYPLISGPAAWEAMTTGGGFVAVEPATGNQVVVRRVKLGYYDSLDDQQYLQPVYVFEGDGGFVGYVPAVDPAWVQE